MNKGKEICNILKEIRQQLAEKNDIEFETSDCHFEGECQGTCSKCEAEVRYLEKELKTRSQLKKVACIAGISLGMAMTFSACTEGDVVDETDYPQDTNRSNLLGDVMPKENTAFMEDIENGNENL